MAITRNAAGLNIVGLDTPEGWDVFVSQNWNQLASVNSVGGFAIVAADLDPATLLPTSRAFNVNAGYMMYRGGFAQFAAVLGIVAPASATSMVWIDAAGAVQVGAMFPAHVPYAPIGSIVTDATKITSIVDYRNPASFVGAPQMVSTNAEPPDADIAAGVAASWYDPTDGAAKVMFKARTNNGTVVRATVPLA